MAIASSVSFNCHQGERESKRANREEATPAACEYSSLSTWFRVRPQHPLLADNDPGAGVGVCGYFGYDAFLGMEISLAEAKHLTCTGDRAAKGTPEKLGTSLCLSILNHFYRSPAEN